MVCDEAICTMKQNIISIGNVVLDMQDYEGIDQYSDGDIENELLNLVRDKKDYDKEIAACDNFAMFYHLSKERELITEVMEISKEDAVLEIGSGCGAITGALAERAGTVHCIELSKRRSYINAYRNQQKENIRIFVGNYENISLSQTYDVITLIGVFEYAASYIHTAHPYHSFLSDVRKKLNQDGRVYIAIENRLGLKYFAGCQEDHAGVVFEGIEGYPNYSKAKTFSYHELGLMFKDCGFENYEFFYPYPDYKFPTEIYSDRYYPNPGKILEKGSNYTSSRYEYFDEQKFLNHLIMKEEFKIFSNSFLACLRK